MSLAFDHRLATAVALKRVPPELALKSGVREALVREASILARLSDTYIVRVFNLGDTLDGMFLVLEYVCGPNLGEVWAQQQADPLTGRTAGAGETVGEYVGYASVYGAVAVSW